MVVGTTRKYRKHICMKTSNGWTICKGLDVDNNKILTKCKEDKFSKVCDLTNLAENSPTSIGGEMNRLFFLKTINLCCII